MTHDELVEKVARAMFEAHPVFVKAHPSMRYEWDEAKHGSSCADYWRSARAAIAAVLARLEAAEAENKRLREALKPFASVNPEHVRTGVWHHFDEIAQEIMTAADFDRARAALEGRE